MEKTSESSGDFKDEMVVSSEFKDAIYSLPRKRILNRFYMYEYQGCWIPSPAIEGMMSFQHNFKARDTDVVLISLPKSGTTWLKALIFSIVNRNPGALLTSSPHELVPFLELATYIKGQNPNLDALPSPRIFATHAPYSLLPRSIKESNCRIVYVCRNPLDHFISLWLFLRGICAFGEDDIKGASIEDAVEMFCEGCSSFGPFWDHVLGYWKQSINKEKEKEKEKVLFLKYEDLKEDTITHLKSIADFLGFPFSEEEEKQGMIEEISSLSSFQSLKNLEPNKRGKALPGVDHSAFFRKGIVGDWSNYLSPSMADRIKTVVQEKLRASPLTFKFSLQNNH